MIPRKNVAKIHTFPKKSTVKPYAPQSDTRSKKRAREGCRPEIPKKKWGCPRDQALGTGQRSDYGTFWSYYQNAQGRLKMTFCRGRKFQPMREGYLIFPRKNSPNSSMIFQMIASLARALQQALFFLMSGWSSGVLLFAY